MTREEAARILVRRAIENNILIRPEACEDCGETPAKGRDGRATIQAHHADYDKPLEVVWLCARCHSKTIEYDRQRRRESHLGHTQSEEWVRRRSESMKRRFAEEPKVAPTGRPWLRFGVPRRTWYRWKLENKLGCRLMSFLAKTSK